jgi:hypothetical protein
MLGGKYWTASIGRSAGLVDVPANLLSVETDRGRGASHREIRTRPLDRRARFDSQRLECSHDVLDARRYDSRVAVSRG